MEFIGKNFNEQIQSFKESRRKIEEKLSNVLGELEKQINRMVDKQIEKNHCYFDVERPCIDDDYALFLNFENKINIEIKLKEWFYNKIPDGHPRKPCYSAWGIERMELLPIFDENGIRFNLHIETNMYGVPAEIKLPVSSTEELIHILQERVNEIKKIPTVENLAKAQ